MRTTLWLGIASLALLVGCAGEVEAESESESESLTEDSSALSTTWAGDYGAVSRVGCPADLPIRHERLRLFVTGRFAYQRVCSASTARPAADAGEHAAGIWKTPFLRANQIKLVEHSERAARWSSLGYASEVDVGRLRLKFEDGKLVRADHGVPVGSLCSQGCARE